MKKVKIMMLSLALLAVVGGALAFKAKVQSRFCSTLAYSYDPAGTQFDRYYCQWGINGQPAPEFEPVAATIGCTTLTVNAVEDPTGLQILCTTVVGTGVNTNAKCQTIKCPNTTSILPD